MNLPLIIATFCHKGGVGKTTDTVGLADALAYKFPGIKILILDADEQSNIKTIFGVKFSNAEGGLAHILLNNGKPEDVIIPVRPSIDVILSGGRWIREFETNYAGKEGAHLLLRTYFRKLDQYDIILVDSPPALSLISSNIVTLADYLLIPCSPELLGFVGVKNTISFLDVFEKQFKERNEPIPVAKVLGVVPNMYDGRRLLDQEITEDLERMANADLLRGGKVFQPIRADMKIRTAQARRKLISELPGATRPIEDFRKLADDICLITNFAPQKILTPNIAAAKTEMKPPRSSKTREMPVNA